MLLAISQRQGNERGGMDSLEASYVKHFGTLGATLVPIPNHAEYVERYFEDMAFDGVILSGGGDVQSSLYGADSVATGRYAPNRDETESQMLNIALAQDIPVLGICRGMERINVYFGGGLQDVASVEGGLDHDETRHEITILDSSISQALGGKTFEVNSYHRTVIGASQLATGLHRFAVAADHTIEAFYHPEYAVAATIWHPERETSPHVLNEYLVSAFLSRKLFWQPRKGVAHEK